MSGARTPSVFPLPVPEIIKVSSPRSMGGIDSFCESVKSGKREKKAICISGFNKSAACMT
jgi:hypothetical protein